MNNARLGWFALLTLIALRVAVGVHFFAEGKTKYKDKKPFSAPFFNASKGPFADFYQGNIWDRDGEIRRDESTAANSWSSFAARAATRYGFDADQKSDADARVETARSELSKILAEHADDIAEYDHQAARRDRNETTPERELTSLQTHDARIASDRAAKLTPWLSKIDKLWASVERDVNAIATVEQQRRGPIALGKPGVRPGDSEFMDQAIPWIHMTIGFCLIVGLLTRTAAIGAAAFLATVVMAQWPWTPGAAPTYYQGVEMFAALAVAGLNAGQAGSVDYLINGFLKTCCKPAANSAGDAPSSKGAKR